MDAARQLFAERGYFATKVDDIAARARVAPATVYAVTGGKYGLLSELIRIWTTDPIVEATTAQFGEMTDAVAIIRELAAGSRRMREQYEDIMRVMLATAPHDPAVAAELKAATSVYRKAFIPIAERLATLGTLRRGIDVAYAVDMFWFYFGYIVVFYPARRQWLVIQGRRTGLPDQASRRTPVQSPHAQKRK